MKERRDMSVILVALDDLNPEQKSAVRVLEVKGR